MVVEAFCTQQMKWFGRVGVGLQSVGNYPVPNIHQSVALLLSVPFFKVSNLFFKFAYTLQQRKLVRLGRKCALLGGKDYSLQFDDLRLDHLTIAQRYHRLRDIAGKTQ